MSKTLTEKPELGSSWRPPRETAPSTVRAEDPTLARWLGLVGLMLVTLGTVALTASALGYASRISPIWGSVFSIFGLALLLFHAAVDHDLQVRRTYGVLGYLWLVAAVLVSVLPIKSAPAGAYFLPYGFTAFVLAFLFLLPFARNETEVGWKRVVTAVFGVVGLVLAAVGFIGGNISENFLLGAERLAPFGVLLIILGLVYLWAFIGLQGLSSNLGYRAALALGVVGALVALIALGRSILPPLFYRWNWISTHPQPYLVPSGLLLTVLGFLYFGVSIGLCSERSLVVMFRRELSAYFYSPIAYIVLFSFAIVSWVLFWQFVVLIRDLSAQGQALPEPVITQYLLAWFPVIAVILAVPVLTMRLLSEEQRTGTLEVLLTAPVSESMIVLSKFFAALVFYVLIWLPWGLCLIALRVEGGQPFEYRPLLSFYLMIICSGAAFLSIGLFISSLTRNQIIAAVLTCMAMLLWTITFFIRRALEEQTGGVSTHAAWVAVLTHVSFLDLWVSSLQGEITPKFYLFPLSVAIFFLFATTKALESRKWR
jgi:ABC-type transport system involved in multi-copper enzyme maturation permease subunit